MSDFISRKTEEILGILQRTRGAHEDCGCGARLKNLKFLLVVSLIATTLPNPILNPFFSIFSVILALVLVIVYRKQIGRRFAVACLFLTLGSIASGCAPLIRDENPEILALCQESAACERFAVVRGVKVLGIPVKRASIDDAKFAAGITRVFATEIISGAGLVSVDQVRVYGT